MITVPCRYVHLSSESSMQNCSSLTAVGETFCSTGLVQPTWVYTRFNSVAYNVTSGFNLSFGHVEVPLLPSQAAADGAETARPRAFPSPLVLRPIHLDIGPVSVVVLGNNDNISGWNTALVLSSSQDAHKASSVWEMFNAKLGDKAWRHAALISVGQTGCDTIASGASPAYVAPQSLAALAGFWFIQMLDSVFSVPPSLAAAYECSALNFSLVDGHQKFLSGLSLFIAIPPAHGNAFFMHTCKLCLGCSHQLHSVQGLPKRQPRHRQRPPHCIAIRQRVILRPSLRLSSPQRVPPFSHWRCSCRRQHIRQAPSPFSPSSRAARSTRMLR
jgi:hypothetical protein